MRVMVYKAREGKRTVLLLPSVRSRQRPMVLRGLPREDLAASVGSALRSFSKPEPPEEGR